MELVFEETGNLEPGEHAFDIYEFEREFVSNPIFSASTTRERIFNNFNELLDTIAENGMSNCISKIWIDGSYCTTKINPNDIDIIIFYDCAAFNKKNLEHFIDLNKTKLKHSKKIHIMCINDFSNCVDYNESDTRKRTDQLINNRIKNYFKFDLKNNEKGFVILNGLG